MFELRLVVFPWKGVLNKLRDLCILYKYMLSLWSLRENVFTSRLHRVIGEGAGLVIYIIISNMAFLLMGLGLYQGD